MKYGYVRVRTDQGEEFKNKQIEFMQNEVDEIIIESDGSELEKLLVALQPGDSLYVYNIDRLTRRVDKAKEIIKLFIDKNISLFTHEGKLKAKNVGYAIGVVQDIEELDSIGDVVEATTMKVQYELDCSLASYIKEKYEKKHKESRK